MDQNIGTNQTGFQNNTMGSPGQTSGVSGVQSVQQLKQQIQTIQGQLRQAQTSGPANQAYTDAANRLQDVFEILNNTQ